MSTYNLAINFIKTRCFVYNFFMDIYCIYLRILVCYLCIVKPKLPNSNKTQMYFLLLILITT